jgi:hypothetical protein
MPDEEFDMMGEEDCRAYTPDTHARKEEHRLLLEFPCNSTETCSV